jgi:hypothetical protein
LSNMVNYKDEVSHEHSTGVAFTDV